MRNISLLVSISAVLLASVLISNEFASSLKANSFVSETPSDRIGFTETELRNQFNYFVSIHSKSYVDIDEYQKRYQIFTENSKYIYEHNLNSDKLGFTLKMNKFGDLSLEEFKNRYLGLKLNEEFAPNSNDFLHEFSKKINNNKVDIPAQIDWRDKGAVSNIKDQGKCKASWVFASVAAIESANRIAGMSSDTLSEQQIIDGTDDEVFQNSGCEDGTIASGYYYAHFKSLGTDSVYPYKGSEGNGKDFLLGNTKHFVKYFQSSSRVDKLTLYTALSQQPVTITVDAGNRAWQFYYGGVLSSGGSYDVNHSVTAVGYSSYLYFWYWNIDYIIIKNSWGRGWGDNGFIYLNTNNGTFPGTCGLYTQITYPVVA